MSDIELIGLPQSSLTWAARIFAHERGVPVTHVPAPPHTPDVNAISPVGKIPVMRHGDIALAETRTICTYLDEQGSGDSLMPRTHAEDQWLSILLTASDPFLIRDYLFAYIFPGTGDGKPDRDRIAGLQEGLDKHLDCMARAVDEGVLGSARSTILDAVATPILFYVSQFPEGKAGIAARAPLQDYLQSRMARPSFAATAPPPPEG